MTSRKVIIEKTKDILNIKWIINGLHNKKEGANFERALKKFPCSFLKN